MNQLISITKSFQWIQKVIGSNSLILPSVIVIGDSGSGKSSVIESLIGGTFIHSRECTTTKRPIIIGLKNDAESFVKFFHKPDELFTDAALVAKEIRNEMTVNTDKQNSALEPIFIQVKSQSVIDLTIVDLPGIPNCKIAVGDQTPELHLISKRTALKYLRTPEAIIICVVAADSDVLKTECIKLVKTADPTGKRVILVLTKLDLMENKSPTIIQEKLESCALLGFRHVIGAVCRSPECIKEMKTINEALAKEKTFLKLYCNEVADRHGISYLHRVLAEMLSNYVLQLLPGTLDVVRSKSFQIQHYLESLSCETTNRTKIILEEVTRYANTYCAALNGTINYCEFKTQELVGGARINYIIHEVFGRSLDLIYPLQGITRTQILTALRNACGVRPDFIFIPEACFESLARRQIMLLVSPCRQLVDLVYDEMLRLIKASASMFHSARYPRLYDHIYSIAGDMLIKRRAKSAQLVDELLEMESAYINTLDSEFQHDIDTSKIAWLSSMGIGLQTSAISGLRTSRSEWFSTQSTSPVANERQQIQTPVANKGTETGLKNEPDVILLETLLSSYFSAVRRSLKHSVPKAIMLRMVNYLNEHLYHTILENLHHETNGDDLLQTPETHLEQCSRLEASLKALENAETILQDIKIQLSRSMTLQV